MSSLTRREFTSLAATAAYASAPKPNILWITCEDTGPHFGAYGDSYARTPNLDRFASRSLLYRNAWSNAPVCAPARTTIITGVYPPSTGSEHMRSDLTMPPFMRMYPQFLREAGYYASNNSKEDYNLAKPAGVWDDSSTKAHWRNRRPGQPFFSIFNFTITHESQIRRRPHRLQGDPAKVRIPAYHPDAPEVRHDWTQYYDNIAAMDGMAGRVLAELESDGLANDTIVFFYGDHGSGMPRSKRWPYNSGLHVPMIVHIPERFRHLAPPGYRPGGETARLVSFVDLAPTLLSLIGVRPPDWMQGHAFLGEHRAPEQPFLYGFRGRMDERFDMVRTVRDDRYVYVRNYMPHLIYGQHVSYMFETPTTRVWKERFDRGELLPAQQHFWKRKLAEELYDLDQDRDEVNNLAGSRDHRKILARMRDAQRELAEKIRDVGFLPEDEIHTRSQGSTPYELARDDRRYPLKKIMDTAEVASSSDAGAAQKLIKRLTDSDSAVRYWAAQGILARGLPAVDQAGKALTKALSDSGPSVRTVAAHALAEHGRSSDFPTALSTLTELADCRRNQYFAALRALNALDALGARAAPAATAIKALPRTTAEASGRTSEYAGRLLDNIAKSL